LRSDRTRYERLEFQHDVNGFLPSVPICPTYSGDFGPGDIMTNSLVTIAAAVAGLVVVAVSAPGFAKSNKHAGEKHAGYAAPLPVIVVRPTTAPEFITVGPNGYWVTTTWGCWVDDGQGRIHDCESGN
jgi:hypothetical protein